MIVITPTKDADKVAAAFTQAGEQAAVIGRVIRAEGEHRVVYDNKLDLAG
jgi:phosphoribosylformylglycinamidine cyclo-ligase